MQFGWGSTVVDLRTSALLISMVGTGLLPGASPSHAEWWKIYAPKDFEDCASSAEQPRLAKDDKAKIIAECDSRFAGRRKIGGGYTYFDFMQNRHFDIAGPNPTAEELKRIDLAYLGYLEQQRKADIAAALLQQQQQQPLPQVIFKPAPQRVSLRQPAPQANQQKLPAQKLDPVSLRPPADIVRGRKDKACDGDIFSCGWAKLSKTAKNLRQTLLTSNSKQDARVQR